MGYDSQQVRDLEKSINSTDCDTVIIATPIDLNRIMDISKPTIRVRYELEEISRPGLEDIITETVLADG